MLSDNKIKENVQKWIDLTCYDVRFKQEGAPYMELLHNIIQKINEDFQMIACKTPVLVYKIGRHLLEKGVPFDRLFFINGKILESFLGDKMPGWKFKEEVDNFMEIYGSDLLGKIVFIDIVGFPITPVQALYFISKIRRSANAMVWFAPEAIADNLTASLAVGVDHLPGFNQFPEIIYNRKKKILDDEY